MREGTRSSETTAWPSAASVQASTIASTTASAKLTPGTTATPTSAPAGDRERQAEPEEPQRHCVLAAQRVQRDPRRVGEQHQGERDLREQLDVLAVDRQIEQAQQRAGDQPGGGEEHRARDVEPFQPVRDRGEDDEQRRDRGQRPGHVSSRRSELRAGGVGPGEPATGAASRARRRRARAPPRSAQCAGEPMSRGSRGGPPSGSVSSRAPILENPPMALRDASAGPTSSASSKPPSRWAIPVSAITTPRIGSRNVVPTFATSTTAPVTVPIAPAASGSRRRGPGTARPHWKVTSPLRTEHADEVHQRRGRAVAVAKARASPRTIAITPRATVIQTSAIGRACAPSGRLVPSESSRWRRRAGSRHSPGLFGVHARRPRGRAADCRHPGRRRMSASLLQSRD